MMPFLNSSGVLAYSHFIMSHHLIYKPTRLTSEMYLNFCLNHNKDMFTKHFRFFSYVNILHLPPNKRIRKLFNGNLNYMIQHLFLPMTKEEYWYNIEVFMMTLYKIEAGQIQGVQLLCFSFECPLQAPRVCWIPTTSYKAESVTLHYSFYLAYINILKGKPFDLHYTFLKCYFDNLKYEFKRFSKS